MAQGDSVYTTNEYSAFQRHNIEDFERMLEESFPAKEIDPGDRRELPSIVDARIFRMGTEEEIYQVTTGDSIEFRVWWRNPTPQETPIQVGIGFMRQDMTTCAGMVTHIDGVKIEGSEGCLILRVPELRLLSGQFLTPVILFDEEGVHKYQEYMMPDNLTVRTHTREVGLVALDHTWECSDQPPPVARNEEHEPATPSVPDEQDDDAGGEQGAEQSGEEESTGPRAQGVGGGA